MSGYFSMTRMKVPKLGTSRALRVSVDGSGGGLLSSDGFVVAGPLNYEAAHDCVESMDKPESMVPQFWEITLLLLGPVNGCHILQA